jgi:hypothetical protein
MKFHKRIRVLGIFFSLFFYSCSSDENVPETRSYQMGFQNSAPRFDDVEIFLQSLNIWTLRADAAIISTEVPWEKLLAGENIVEYVVNNYKGLAEYYRSKNLTLWMYIDPQNGLDNVGCRGFSRRWQKHCATRNARNLQTICSRHGQRFTARACWISA